MEATIRPIFQTHTHWLIYILFVKSVKEKEIIATKESEVDSKIKNMNNSGRRVLKTSVKKKKKESKKKKKDQEKTRRERENQVNKCDMSNNEG